MPPDASQRGGRMPQIGSRRLPFTTTEPGWMADIRMEQIERLGPAVAAGGPRRPGRAGAFPAARLIAGENLAEQAEVSGTFGIYGGRGVARGEPSGEQAQPGLGREAECAVGLGGHVEVHADRVPQAEREV